MKDKETWEQELKNATSSYRTMPMWMRRIEQKTRKTTSLTSGSPTGEQEVKKSKTKSKAK